MNLKNNFSTKIAKKIFGNEKNAVLFLIELFKEKNIEIPYKKNKSGNILNELKLSYSNEEIYKNILKYWDYNVALKIIRQMFINTEKYKSGKESYNVMNVLFEEWTRLNLGKIEWPFTQSGFDKFVQSINSTTEIGILKDDKVKIAAVKYRRIKEINTVRNDFIETLIFEKNTNILPTLNHNRGVDFYIDGISFDQKVARSPTKEFKKKYGDNWKEFAIKNPNIVAQYLYQFQDEERFGNDSRLLVVYLDEDISINKISEIIKNTNLIVPNKVTFEYKHNANKSNEKIENYSVECFVILLYN